MGQKGPWRTPFDFLLVCQDDSISAMVDLQEGGSRVPGNLHLPRAISRRYPVLGALAGVSQTILWPSLDTEVRCLM